MNYRLALILCALTAVPAMAQAKLDSLKTIYRQAIASGDREGAGYYAAVIGEHLLRTTQYDSAISYYRQALRFSSRPPLVASTFNGLGVAYNYKGYPDSCVRYYKEASELYKSFGDSTNAANTEANLAIVYKNLGWYDEALQSSLDALAIFERQPPGNAASSACSNLGSIYLLTGDVGRAIHYHRRALQMRRDAGYERGVGQSLTNIGEAYISLEKYDSALAYLMQASEVKRKLKNNSELATTLKQIGRVYLLTNNTSAAEAPLLEAASIKHQTGERASEGDVLNNVGHLRILQRRYQEARTVLQQANVLLRESSDLANLSRNLELQVELSKLQGNSAAALAFAEELGAVKDSLLNARKAEIILSLETRYETEKRQKQILALENERYALDASIKEREIYISVLVAGIVLALLFGIILYRQNKSLREARDLNALLLQEVNHRVKNNLQIISTLFRLPYQGLEDSDTLRLIKSGESRVNAMALIHRQLSEKTSYRTIQLSVFVKDLVLYLDQSFGFSENGGKLDVDCCEKELDIDTAIPLALIVNELLANALKHAAASRIEVHIGTSGKGLDVTVSDNGIGSQRRNSSTGGFGLRLITMMVKELRGAMSGTTENGTTTNIHLPLIQ